MFHFIPLFLQNSAQFVALYHRYGKFGHSCNEVNQLNTPTHVTLALAALGRKGVARYDNLWIIAGALAPDAVMYLLIIVSLILGYAPQVLFDTLYFSALWQVLIAPLNSIPLLAAFLALAHWRRWRGGKLFALGALLHIAFDLPLHREDAHHHFWPFSDYQFLSPVSYWDPNHYAGVVMPIELLLLLVTLAISTRYLQTRWGRRLYLVINGGFAVLFAGAIIAGFF